MGKVAAILDLNEYDNNINENYLDRRYVFKDGM